MAKKQKQPTNENVEVIVPDEEKTIETPKTETKSKQTKKDKVEKVENKDTKDKSKSKTKKKEKKSIKKKASEVWSELKKVSKPSFGTVVKNTCVVITVVAICTILLFGVDKLFSLIYTLLIPNG